MMHVIWATELEMTVLCLNAVYDVMWNYSSKSFIPKMTLELTVVYDSFAKIVQGLNLDLINKKAKRK